MYKLGRLVRSGTCSPALWGGLAVTAAGPPTDLLSSPPIPAFLVPFDSQRDDLVRGLLGTGSRTCEGPAAGGAQQQRT